MKKTIRWSGFLTALHIELLMYKGIDMSGYMFDGKQQAHERDWNLCKSGK